MRSWRARSTSVAIAGVLVLLLGATGARADGMCGRRDDSGPAACPIHGNGTYSGSLTVAHDPYPAASERDYFVFHAKAGTALDVTVHDDSDPDCAGGPTFVGVCGIVGVQLLSGDGNLIAYNHDEGATFDDGVAVPAILDHTIRHAGTFYLVISGSLNREITGPGPMLTPVPYSVSVSGTPDVFWPARCTVPHVRHHESLAAAKRYVTRNGCHIGRITRRRDRGVPAGDVLGFGAPSGRVFAHNTRIGIVVARR